MFSNLLLILTGVIVVVAIVSLIRFERIVRHHQFKLAGLPEHAPTVSVCIPARNEVHAMTECLERILASDYPKLEILVLDDSSVDDTSVLVKSFAHAGVRFVEGTPLPEGWLGKNHALQGLLEEASGQYILFLDVDTTVRSVSISRLVAHAQARSISLVSVLPQREDGLRASVFLGTLRYFWVLFLSNHAHPAMSGATWLVAREQLLALGGFGSFKDLTQPEDAIAQAFDGANNSQLILGSKELGIGYEKKWSSQVETSVRLLQPLFGGAIQSILMALALMAVVVVPITGLIAGFIAQSILGVGLAVAALVIITTLSLRFFRIAWRYGWWLGAIHWPYTLLQEAILLLRSVSAYRQGRVTWKGRPIETTR